MDDSCAVCADTLEWVAYGPCGHREVCSTCVARLRFICDDRRCCICKTDCSFVFVTKALGDYTRMINDFSTLPAQVREGQVGSYWYHEDTQAFFDDAEHYKMIRAMCRLSCSICDKDKQRFRNIVHLKRHLSNEHAFRMCDLCLEGRKVFICEQKLYTRAQLNRHMRTGDSEVDGTESERGGFAGHPMCEFCRSSFYGENELYSHMSTEHYTCHICQRRHPGQYEYYKDYDDLETHFRHDHCLCEDEACLAKKFIVFQTEADLKRHNALEHGGRMSRSKRNAVLQIPTSFRYRSSNESGQHRGRRRSFRRESSPDHELNMAIEASLDRTNANDPVAGPSASLGSEPSVGADSSDADPLVQPFESLNTTDSEPSSRYRQAVAQTSTNASLTGSLFPPLSTAHGSSQQKSQKESQNTMAARLRRQNNATVLNVAQPRSTVSRGPVPATSVAWPTPTAAQATSAAWPAPVSSTSAFRPASTPAPGPIPVPTSGAGHMKPAAVNGSGSSSYAGSVHGRQMNEPGLIVGSSWGSRNVGSGNRLNHSNSAPNLSEIRSFDPVSDFPPVSAAQPTRLQPTAQPKKTEDVQTANKSLVERMRAALDYDENKYSAFKEISQEYRQGVIDTWEYLEYVKQFDLMHLVLDLARLCPDVRKQKELIEAYNATCLNNGTQDTIWGNGNFHFKGNSGSSSRKNKGKKVMDNENNSHLKEGFAENVISTVKSLQSQLKPFEGEVEILEKDGYRRSKGKSTTDSTVARGETLTTNAASQTATVDTGSKPKKKTSKFHRTRLGEDSEAAVLDVRNSSTDGNSAETGWPKPLEGSSASAHSVWRKGDAQRLFAK